MSAEILFYSAEISAPDGTNHGPLDMTGAKNDSHALELALVRGKEWLQTSGFDHVTIQISSNGRGLSPVKVSR
ncbi:MAG TPA: hypothetical protein VMU78_01475 [Methylocella sp.]|nr:hypothetical protein [Methylocella sp.]